MLEKYGFWKRDSLAFVSSSGIKVKFPSTLVTHGDV